MFDPSLNPINMIQRDFWKASENIDKPFASIVS
jgi:hypothetical protein